MRIDTKMNTGFYGCAVLATIVLVLGIYAHGHWWGELPKTATGFNSWSAWRFKLFGSGMIPYAIFWAFLFGMFYLVQIWIKKYVPLGISNAADAGVIAAVRNKNDLQLVAELNAQKTIGYYGYRLRTMRNRYNIDQDLSAVQAMKDDFLSNDEEDMVLSFNAVSWAEWALPMLGFLGTVVGIGEALGGIQEGVQVLFGASGRQGGDAAALLKFNAGFAGLAVAFDTTFLGLIFLLTLGLFKVSLKKMIARRLADAREIFFEAVSMWRTGDGTQSMVVLAMSNLLDRMGRIETLVRLADQRGDRVPRRGARERVVGDSREPRFTPLQGGSLQADRSVPQSGLGVGYQGGRVAEERGSGGHESSSGVYDPLYYEP
jgi:hypothetical protein